MACEVLKLHSNNPSLQPSSFASSHLHKKN